MFSKTEVGANLIRRNFEDLSKTFVEFIHGCYLPWQIFIREENFLETEWPIFSYKYFYIIYNERYCQVDWWCEEDRITVIIKRAATRMIM